MNNLEAPNYTQIPNVVFDHWMPILSPITFKVFLLICRKTFGWHKGSDRVSLNQLMEMTGLSKPTILKGIEELERAGLIEVKKNNTHSDYILKDPSDIGGEK